MALFTSSRERDSVENDTMSPNKRRRTFHSKTNDNTLIREHETIKNIENKVDTHIPVAKKGDLINLTWDFQHSNDKKPVSNTPVFDPNIDASDVNVDDIKLEQCSEEVDKILDPPDVDNVFNDSMLIVGHKHHAGSL